MENLKKLLNNNSIQNKKLHFFKNEMQMKLKKRVFRHLRHMSNINYLSTNLKPIFESRLKQNGFAILKLGNKLEIKGNEFIQSYQCYKYLNKGFKCFQKNISLKKRNLYLERKANNHKPYFFLKRFFRKMRYFLIIVDFYFCRFRKLRKEQRIRNNQSSYEYNSIRIIATAFHGWRFKIKVNLLLSSNYYSLLGTIEGISKININLQRRAS